MTGESVRPLFEKPRFLAPTNPLVARPRLIERLNQALQPGHKLTLISAPAGSAEITLEYLYAGDSSRQRLLADYHETSVRLQQEPGSRPRQKRLAALTSQMERTGGWSAEAEAKALLSQLGVPEFEVQVDRLSGGQRST